MSLSGYIQNEIRHNGPMDVGAYMGLAVSHYYNSRDPFGAAGDFTTAPEISQMFGELLGAWAADCWMQLGSPSPFILAECGPGRGTLMADALRATAKVPGFHAAADIRLIEASAALKQKQRETLKDYEINWHERIEELPPGPMILLANEFLDALPVRQIEFRDGKWHERVIGLDAEGALRFGLVPAAALEAPGDAEEGAVYEIAPARTAFIRTLCARPGSTALFIDYGYVAGAGDTLQAMRGHQYVPVLESPGEADLTAHVDFAALARAAEGMNIYGPVAQGEFLDRLGIRERAAMLKQKATREQATGIDKALHRLMAPEEMGKLFKVIAISDQKLALAGF